MTLEELKALEDVIDWDDQYFAYISHRNRKLILLAPEILALVEAATADATDADGVLCPCPNPLCSAVRAFNAKLGTL
jgi:hypothetical protein